MPGPLAGQLFVINDARERHQKCQQKQACVGPGCKITTGKTEKKRKNRERKRS